MRTRGSRGRDGREEEPQWQDIFSPPSVATQTLASH
uniref:Uncharacterized protein n=1 Tax=Arundo donax TaxID=35708 RepID=A0A0A9FIV9_ARUDO